VAPLAGVLAVFFLLPLAITVVVSFWRYTEYSMIPALVGDNYVSCSPGAWPSCPPSASPSRRIYQR